MIIKKGNLKFSFFIKSISLILIKKDLKKTVSITHENK